MVNGKRAAGTVWPEDVVSPDVAWRMNWLKSDASCRNDAVPCWETSGSNSVGKTLGIVEACIVIGVMVSSIVVGIVVTGVVVGGMVAGVEEATICCGRAW